MVALTDLFIKKLLMQHIEKGAVVNMMATTEQHTEKIAGLKASE
jgi:hypothetical protein